MATVKAILWKHQQNKDGTYPIRIRITKNGKSTYLSIGYSVKEVEWDERYGLVKKPHANSVRLNNLIAKRIAEYRDAAIELETRDAFVGIKKIKLKLKGTGGSDFFPFAYTFLEQYNNEEAWGTYKSYKSAIVKFHEFMGHSSLSFNDLDYKLMQDYRNHLVATGNNANTRTQKIKKIRTIYKAAIRAGIAEKERYPFEGMAMEYNKSRKEKLTAEELNSIRKLDLEVGSIIWHVRNIFLFCFNCQGMRFGDAVMLRKGNIAYDRLEYTMDKTGDLMSVLLTEEASSILKGYDIPTKGADDYIFPFLNNSRRAYKYEKVSSATAVANKYLKKIAELACIEKSISTHLARHSWAQQAKNKHIDTSVIQQAFGHSSSKTTEIYLSSFADSVIDEANKIVVGS